MNDKHEFVQEAHRQLERIEHELNEIEGRIKNAGGNVDRWTDEQFSKLKSDWHTARHEIEAISDKYRTAADASWEELKSDAEHHWQALKAAVQTYRNHVDERVA